jgi:hypothetical protein
VPYEEEEEGDILPEDADDIHVEIGSYKFQEGDFVWREVDVPSVAATSGERNTRAGTHVFAERDLPPFRLGEAKCKNIKAETQTAWDYLGLLLDADLILMLVCCTNDYARRSGYKDTRRGKEWRDCEEAEMRLFLAVVCYMGVVRVPSRHHIFDPSSIYGQEWVFSKMSGARFDALSRCLHSDSPWDFTPQEREEKNKRDPFWQTDAFCERLSDNFSRYRKQQFPRPTVCKNYNKSMGGTDLADFYLAEYATSHRAKRWQPKILFHCIQQAVVNAHILCCSKNGVSNAQFPLLDFITQLLQEIAPKPALPAQDPTGYKPAVMSARNRSWWNAKVKLRTEGRHFPDKFSNPLPQEFGQKRPNNRRKCIYCCERDTLTFCSQCGVHLCLGRCYHAFHTLHDLDRPPENVANAAPGLSSDSD